MLAASKNNHIKKQISYFMIPQDLSTFRTNI